MDFSQLNLRRESCRSFNGKPVDKEILQQIAEAGRLAPSACNSQPWHFYVVSNAECCQRLRKAIQVFGSCAFTDKASAFIVIEGEKPNYPERVGQAVSGRDFSSIDIGLTTENMVLCAASLGVSSCILGTFVEGKVKEALNIDKKNKKPIRLIIALGYNDNLQPRGKKRKSFEEAATFID